MTTPSNNPVEKSEDSVFGLSDLFTILRFVLHAILRHKLIVFICIVLVVAAGYGVVKILPRTYQVYTEILAHPSSTISNLADTGRSVNRDEILFGISQMMKSRANLEGIVDETDLVKLWNTTRHPTQKFIGDTFARIFGPPTEQELRDNLIEVLDNRLWVEIRYQENVIAITVNWNNPWVAQEIQKVIINRFFEERRKLETSEINDTIKLLEGKYNSARKRLDAIAEKNKSMITKTEALESREQESQTAVTRRRRISLPSNQSALTDKQREELELANEELEAIEDEIARLTEAYNRRLAAEQQELGQLQATVGPQHPERIERERFVELLSKQSPIPEGLRQKRKALEAFINNLKKQAAAATETPKPTVAVLPRRSSTADEPAEPADATTSAQLEFESQLISEEYSAMSRTVNLLETRLANARMELTATEAAFAYRYHLTRPPVFPRRPVKPNPMKLMIMALALSIFLGIFMAVFVDLRSGIILESWQVEKIANVPLLGEIKHQ